MAVGTALARVSATSGTSSVQLTITPSPLPADVPAVIRLDGLRSGQEVTLRAEFADGVEVRWGSEATFVADRLGVVDLTRQAPCRGSYDVVDPMGLIWAAEPLSGGIDFRQFEPLVHPNPVSVSASVAGRTIAAIEVPRTLVTSEIEVIPVPGPGVVGWLYRPVSGGPLPAVMVFGGSEGGLAPYVEREAALLARHGFAALAVAYFGMTTLPPTPTEIPLEYFEGLIRWLQNQPGIDAGRLAVIGHSRGGELALLLGATYPEFNAVVSYVGSGVVFPSYDDAALAAWTLGGEPVPYWNYFDESTLDPAIIAVERINGPVLLISGQRDLRWFSFALSEFAMDRWAERGHAFSYEHLAYRDAGHLIQAPFVPSTWGLHRFGGTAAGTAAANADSWPRVLKMLDDRLKR